MYFTRRTKEYVMKKRTIIQLIILVMVLFALFLLVFLPPFLEGKILDEQLINTDKAKDQKVKNNLYEAPLTGIEGEEPFLLRPIVATISNDPHARPQKGLSLADYTYEFLIEGKGTRFVAIYQSEWPEEIGPMRSARHYFYPIARDLDSLYVAHGFSRYALNELQRSPLPQVNGIDHEGTLFQRSTDRKAPHNSYIQKSGLEKGMEMNHLSFEKAPRTTLSFHKVSDDDIMRENASTIVLNYYDSFDYKVEYTYDEQTNTYIRSTGNQTMYDALTDEIVKYSNILVIEVPYQLIDSDGRRDVQLSSGSKGYLFQDGRVTTMDWKYQRGVIQPMDGRKPLTYTKGNTIVHVVPKETGIDRALMYEQ